MIVSVQLKNTGRESERSCRQSCQEFSEVTWSRCWWGSSVVSWKSVCEEKTRGLVWNGFQPGTQLVELSVDKTSARAAVARGPECGSWRISVEAVARKRLVETLMDWERWSVWQWSVKCSSEQSIQMTNKSIKQSIPRLQSHTPKSSQCFINLFLYFVYLIFIFMFIYCRHKCNVANTNPLVRSYRSRSEYSVSWYIRWIKKYFKYMKTLMINVFISLKAVSFCMTKFLFREGPRGLIWTLRKMVLLSL
jgi:hypothetical protein